MLGQSQRFGLGLEPRPIVALAGHEQRGPGHLRDQSGPQFKQEVVSLVSFRRRQAANDKRKVLIRWLPGFFDHSPRAAQMAYRDLPSAESWIEILEAIRGVSRVGRDQRSASQGKGFENSQSPPHLDSVKENNQRR